MKVLRWVVEGKMFDCRVDAGACPFCFKQHAVVALPPPLRDAQPDDTTHVCHPALGGYNQGFADTRGKS